METLKLRTVKISAAVEKQSIKGQQSHPDWSVICKQLQIKPKFSYCVNWGPVKHFMFQIEHNAIEWLIKYTTQIASQIRNT